MILVLQNDPLVTPGAWALPLAPEGPSSQLVPAYGGSALPDPASLQGAVILGGTMNVDDTDIHPFLVSVRQFMEGCLRTGTPLLGICLGGQLLAQITGGEVRANRRGEKGLQPVTLTPEGQKDPLFAGFANRFTAFQWHNDSFTPPVGCQHLASSETCPYQAFRVADSWGLQFHPEVDARLVGSWSSLFAPGSAFLQEFLLQEDDYRHRFRRLLNNFIAYTNR